MNDQHRLNTSKRRKQKSYKTSKIHNVKTNFYKPPNYVATTKLLGFQMSVIQGWKVEQTS